MNKLKTMRKAINLTQEALAKRAGISYRAYQNYESGERVPNAYVAVLIAKALNSSVEEIFSTND